MCGSSSGGFVAVWRIINKFSTHKCLWATAEEGIFSPCPKCVNCFTNISFGHPNGTLERMILQMETDSGIKSQLPRVTGDIARRFRHTLSWQCNAQYSRHHCQPLVGSVLAMSHIYVWEVKQTQSPRVCFSIVLCVLSCVQLFCPPLLLLCP